MESNLAPGQPGSPADWNSSKKNGVGTACNQIGRVWFTLSDGIFNEVFYPRLDCACTRDMQMVVTDGEKFFSEERRDTESTTHWMETGVPAFHIVNSERNGRYRIEKNVYTDPDRAVLLQRTRFFPHQGKLSNYHLYVLLAPHLANVGSDNTAWLGEFKGIPMLMAEHNGIGMALACSAPWLNRSAGYVGVSDGWQDLAAHKKMTWSYERAQSGNVALTAEIDIQSCSGEFVLALGFGQTAMEAAHRARASLMRGHETAWQTYRLEWEDWHKTLLPLDTVDEEHRNPFRISATVLRCHEASNFPGGTIASLSIPWGLTHGVRDTGGYHLVWPRDSFEAAGAMLAAGAPGDAQRVLEYLSVTQEADGHWPQNMWLDGTPFLTGIQLDEVAAPLVLIDLARRENMLPESELKRLWPMVRKAAGYIVRNGPVTMQDRWEEQTGFSPYTLAVCIAGLLSAADLIDLFEPGLGDYLRQTADAWNDSIETWTYATDAPLADEMGVDGFYMRIVPSDPQTGVPLPEAMVTEKHFPPPNNRVAANEHISPDALALVRFGLRSPDDPRILDTIQVIDSMLRMETPLGPCWYRFNGDGYGEKADGSPFLDTGIGRLWPLLTGERAHYEIAAGNWSEARRLLGAMENFSGRTGLISEQIWDSPDIPERKLFLGQPSTSARPLVWAHAEHLKLIRSLRDRKVFDMPPHASERYLVDQITPEHTIWRFNLRTQIIGAGQKLRIETLAPVQVHWSCDDWLSTSDLGSCDTGIGIHIVDLPTEELAEDSKIVFTFFWPQQNRWEGEDFSVRVVSSIVPDVASQRAAEQRAIYRPARASQTTQATRRVVEEHTDRE